jgi:hypothetical protein
MQCFVIEPMRNFVSVWFAILTPPSPSQILSRIIFPLSATRIAPFVVILPDQRIDLLLCLCECIRRGDQRDDE